jgi:acetyl-CoA C-acetyltransferase
MARLPRIPLATPNPKNWQNQVDAPGLDCGVSQLAVSVKADGAAFVVLMSRGACRRYAVKPNMRWLAHTSVGHAPELPLLAAEAATQLLLNSTGHDNLSRIDAIELHDAFAVQGIGFSERWNLAPDQINTYGGGLARGHPIGASGAIALVQLLRRLTLLNRPQALGLTALAAAGGLGSAALLQKTA